MENKFKDGSMKFVNKDGTPLSGAYGGGRGASLSSAAKPASPFGFGMKGPGLTGGPAEATFEKMKKAPELQEGGDIFHEGYAGSIFDIVSVKLTKTHDRIDELEWDTPLNRALAGLPAKKDKK